VVITKYFVLLSDVDGYLIEKHDDEVIDLMCDKNL
jgi:hypothetical protein